MNSAVTVLIFFLIAAASAQSVKPARAAITGIDHVAFYTTDSDGVRRLYSVDEAAAALGLYAGQKATDAMALVPELAIADADPAGDLAALEALVLWCVRFSPAVATPSRRQSTMRCSYPASVTFFRFPVTTWQSLQASCSSPFARSWRLSRF